MPRPPDIAAALLAWTRHRTRSMVSMLEALVQVESPSVDPHAQEQLFALLATLLADLDHTVFRLPGRHTGGLLVSRPRIRDRGRGLQLIVGHSDTVWPHGTLQGRPFRVRDGRAWGPGTYDTKAGLVQAIVALRALQALGLEPPLTPVLLINADEETGSLETGRHVERIAKRARRAWVLEPSLGPEGHLKTARKGVGHFTVVVRGRAAHAGLEPERGVNAIVAMASLIGELHALNDPARGTTVNVGEVSGGTRRNVIPAEARIEVDARAWTIAEADRITDAIRRSVPRVEGATVEVRGGFVKPPLERGEATLALWESARTAAAQLGIPLDHGSAGGASDGNLTAKHCPTLDGLGAVGDGAHATHEHVVVDRMPERAALLALLLMSDPPPAVDP